MTIELKVPDVGESIQEVQIGRWLKQEGDPVERDEDVVELETDKASMELPSPSAGVIQQILVQEGESVSVGDVVAKIDENGKPRSDKATDKKKTRREPESEDSRVEETHNASDKDNDKSTKAHQANEHGTSEADDKQATPDVAATPSGRRALREHGLKPEEVPHSDDRVHGADVENYVEQLETQDDAPETDHADLEETVPMSMIRRRIAERLVAAQQKAALLTTYNEIDMSAVINLRQAYQQRFQKRYGIKLGFMSFFVKAVIDALKQFPELNAEIRGDDIVYRNYYHIGIAIGGEKGLVVPVVRHAERLSFAEIERAIDDFATRADENKLKPDELAGGTFTLSNGGIYGSLLSTPIVNPPQSGVLGMHAIEERPVAVAGEVVIRPMMYVALTYDHRIVDGQQAVTFLRRVKEAIEEPSRMLIEV